MSDKAIEAFRNSIKNSDETDVVKKVSKAMIEMDKEILKSFPLELRINSILGLIANAQLKDENFQLNKTVVNELLQANIGPYDYNIIPEINSVEDILDLRNDIMMSIIGQGNWRKCHCKKCNEDFYLSFGEVQFYEQKGFPLPKQCKYCKKGIEKPKKVVEKKKEEVVEKKIPTAMEIALKKAGL